MNERKNTRKKEFTVTTRALPSG